jgi:hypothetical protein
MNTWERERTIFELRVKREEELTKWCIGLESSGCVRYWVCVLKVKFALQTECNIWTFPFFKLVIDDRITAVSLTVQLKPNYHKVEIPWHRCLSVRIKTQIISHNVPCLIRSLCQCCCSLQESLLVTVKAISSHIKTQTARFYRSHRN